MAGHFMDVAAGNEQISEPFRTLGGSEVSEAIPASYRQ
jgi:hypothetical protein